MTPSLPSLEAPRTVRVGPAPWWLRGGHLETIVPSLLHPSLAPLASERRVVPVAPGSAVEAWLSRPLDAPGAARGRRGSVLVVHGLGGSADGAHVRAMAAEAVADGWHAVRVNLRTHGHTAALASTLFNAAQSDDIGAVLLAMEDWGLPRPYVVLGVSLGANMALRYAALHGVECRADAVAALNPAVDFFRIEREISRPANALYRYAFVRSLCRIVAEVRALRDVPGPPASPWRIHSVRQFDALFTAPAAGYPSVDAYYADAGAASVVDGIRRPTLLLSAANDPFVPPDIIAPLHGRAGGLVEVRLADRGGHVGYRVVRDGRAVFWPARPLLDWATETLGLDAG